MHPLLDAIQGNVLKPFHRKHAEYLFLRFDADAGALSSGLRSVLMDCITSAARQAALTALWKDSQQTPPVGMFALTSSGYDKLGRADAAALGSTPFRDGMLAQRYVWAATPQEWEVEYRDQGIDAFVLLAHDDRNVLFESVAKLTSDMKAVAKVVKKESGNRLPDAAGKDIEHFGFRENLTTMNQPGDVFTPDGANDSDLSYGCFATFLKIEQNVDAFVRTTEQLAEKANALPGTDPPVTPAQIRELAMGRRFNGEGLVPPVGEDPDSFTFQGVPQAVCPYHAHTRVMNQRDGVVLPKIIRRSLAYGPPRLDLQPGATGVAPPASGSGLLFLSFQRSLLDFITLMGKAQRSFDPILVRCSDWVSAIPENERAQIWCLRGHEIRHRIACVTKVLGGGYFYIPGIPFIRGLS